MGNVRRIVYELYFIGPVSLVVEIKVQGTKMFNHEKKSTIVENIFN